MKLSFIIISFKSYHLLEKLLSKIPRQHEIIIVENSLEVETKYKIEKKYKNSKVIIPKENLGYSTAFNKAFKMCKNNFLITISPDVKIEKKLFKKIENLLLKFKNFSLLAPEYRNKKIYQNFIHSPDTQIIPKINNYKIVKVKEIDWCFCILNKSKFKNRKILDENFFLYFETIDLCRKLFINKKNMYVVKNLKFDHLGTSSSHEKYKFEIQMNRNWHFSWSKFYFFKKNYNYLFALKKILPNIFQSLIGIILCTIIFNYKDTKLHFSSLKGFLSSILLMKSYFRLNLD